MSHIQQRQKFQMYKPSRAYGIWNSLKSIFCMPAVPSSDIISSTCCFPCYKSLTYKEHDDDDYAPTTRIISPWFCGYTDRPGFSICCGFLHNYKEYVHGDTDDAVLNAYIYEKKLAYQTVLVDEICCSVREAVLSDIFYENNMTIDQIKKQFDQEIQSALEEKLYGYPLGDGKNLAKMVMQY